MPPKGKGKGKGKGKKGKDTHRKTSTDGGSRIFQREVIFDILSCLPVKSLLRFKSVSKQWRNVISLPSFMSVHLTRSPASLLIYARKPPISDEEDHPNGHVIFSYQPSKLEPIPDFPGFDAAGVDDHLEVIGSAPNGVVCVVQKPYAQKFTLWNPATRSTLSIPSSGIEPDPFALFGASAGLGFDPSSNEYKLIRILRFSGQPLPDVAELFNFKTGLWDLIPDSDNNNEKNGHVAFRFEWDACEAVVNGVPYWRGLEDDVDFGTDLKLVWFDVKESVFKSEWFPWETENKEMRMGEIGGCLGVILWDKVEEVLEDRILEVWVRRSENGSWDQKYRINQRYTVVGRVVGFYAAGIMQEILIGDDGIPRLYWTTLADVAIRAVFSIAGSRPGSCNVVNYRESLTRMPTIRFSMIGRRVC